MVLLHLLAVVAAFGPLLIMGRLYACDPAGTARLYLRFSLPTLVALWVFGMGAVGMSDKEIAMSDTWIVLSLLVWAILVAIAVAVILPATKESGPSARSKLMAGLGASHLLMIVAVILMVFKPGS